MEWSSKRWEEVLFHDTESQQEEEEWSAVLKDTDESEERPVIRRLEALEERCPQISVRVKVKKSVSIHHRLRLRKDDSSWVSINLVQLKVTSEFIGGAPTPTELSGTFRTFGGGLRSRDLKIQPRRRQCTKQYQPGTGITEHLHIALSLDIIEVEKIYDWQAAVLPSALQFHEEITDDGLSSDPSKWTLVRQNFKISRKRCRKPSKTRVKVQPKEKHGQQCNLIQKLEIGLQGLNMKLAQLTERKISELDLPLESESYHSQEEESELLLSVRAKLSELTGK
ncbi:hypothetical protein V8E54_014999 [Elaphomyces granulatus]